MDIRPKDPNYTFYVDSSQQVTITCPRCGLSKTLDASPFKAASKELAVNCKCGQRFTCHLEFRRAYRKKVSLKGHYRDVTSGDDGDMTVEDISIGGVGFSTLAAHDIRKGDTVEVVFRLDTPRQPRIERIIEVAVVKHRFIGGSFKDGRRDADLGFYLMG